MSTYHGHRNWAFWNVSLWLNNDEGLYFTLRDAYAATGNKRRAAAYMLGILHDAGITQTPDGATYTQSNIAAAINA